MSAAGQIVPSKEWIHRMVEICKARDILMVAPEALTCFGRTGKWFAFEHFDFVPDIVTCSKGLGGGVPLCAVVTSAEIADGAVAKGYMPFSSHAGDPLLCATGLANIEIVERDNLVENARVVGAYFMEKLLKMQIQYEIAGEARGLGLCLGLELVTDKKSREPNFEGGAAVTNYCYENSLWLPIVPMAKFDDPLQRRFMEMSGSHVLRFMPPITVTKAQIDEAMEILDAGLRIAEEQTARGASAAG